MAALEVVKVGDKLPQEPEGGMYPAPVIFAPKSEANYKPEDDLLDTRSMRGAIVKSLTASGIPVADKSQMALLLTTLQHQDQQALGSIRAKVEAGAVDEIAAMKAQAHAMITAMREAGSNIIPRRNANAGEIIDVPSLDVKTLPEDEVQPFVNGQLDVGTSNMTFETFVKENGEVKLAEEEQSDD